MKKFLLFFLWGILLYSCDLKNEEKITSQTQLEDGVYTFSQFSDPNFWKNFHSTTEIQSACQIPEDLLKEMSTDNLVKSCMNYPLFFTYTAYTNELVGISEIINSFNGLKELMSREDGVKKLINLYQKFNIDPKGNVMCITKAGLPSKLSFLHLGYIELLLSSKEVSNQISNEDVSKLKTTALNLYQKKLENVQSFSMDDIKNSLLLSSRLKLIENSNNVDAAGLNDFILKGGIVEARKYETLSRDLMTK
ncbi:MAG: hypothetical protein M0R37_10090 [Bacteroidales bacterium]|nr:hypothetical protein [Bacteroidales bacterium]